MTIEEWVNKTQSSLDRLLKSNKPLQIAARTTLQKASKRIFVSSQTSTGGNITYSAVSGFSRDFKREGAYSKSYAQFRKRKGRNIDKVYLALTGDFRSDYMNGTIPSQAAPIKVNPHEYKVELSRGKSSGISHAELKGVFERNFYNAKIFTHSKEEVEEFYRIATHEFKQLFI